MKRQSLLIVAFMNEASCRRDSNQHKAQQIWQEIKQVLTVEDARALEIEWAHYLLNEMTTSQFGQEIRKTFSSFL